MKHFRSRLRLMALPLTPLLLWLALPGKFAWWGLLPVSLIPLFFILGGVVRCRSALGWGLAGGMLLYLLQVYWIVPVLITYGGLPWFLAVPAMLLLVFYMSCYLALFGAVFVLLGRSPSIWVFLFGSASLWVGLDWLRGWLFSGFPWMDLGYGFASVPLVLQAADIFGHYGLTFFVVLANGVLYCLASGRHTGRQRLLAATLVAGLAGAMAAYGTLRQRQVEELAAAADTAVIGIVQGNVDQARKWAPDERQAIVSNYLRLSGALVDKHDTALVVWPETALPFYPRSPDQLRPLARFVSGTGVALLTGSPWLEVHTGTATRLVSYYNAALLMGGSGRFEGFYYKSHLVPYGEYVPFQEYMTFLSPLVEAAGNFSPGTVEAPLASGAIRAGVLICFESIFERIGRAWVKNGANVLINLTNDAWYGKSSAPFQSWAMTVYRAVETRRSVVRSANTGISGVIDPLGRPMVRSGIFVEWTGAAAVPLLSGTTVFTDGGYLFAPGCAAAALIILGVGLKSAQRTGRLVV